MSTSSRHYPNLYKDSVSLMAVTARVTGLAGIEGGSVVMASATNVENLAAAGLGDFELLAPAVYVLAGLTLITTIQRIAHVRGELRRAAMPAGEGRHRSAL